MKFATYTIQPEDYEDSARAWALIDLENATRIPERFNIEEVETPKVAATNKALARGWHVNPVDTETPDVLKG